MRATKGTGTPSKQLLTFGVILTLFLLIVPAAPARSAPDRKSKLSSELSRNIGSSAADDLVPVIVQTVASPSATNLTRLHGRGGVVKAMHSAIQGYSASLPASQIADFADDPEIEQISYDTPVRARMNIAAPAVKADVAFSEFGLDGSGIGIAVIDTGVAAHPDLLRPKGSPQVVEVEIVGHEPGLADYYGHGTHVAGILSGNGASSTCPTCYKTFKGIAPGAQIISLRALQPDGTGSTSDIISAIDWVLKFKPQYNVRVINLSLGHPVYESYATDPLCRAVRAANDAGVVVVAAAGNEGGVGTGFGTIDSPGNEPSAITVGAMDDSGTVVTSDDVLAWYSSKGPALVDLTVKPDLVAPGSSIVSLRDPGSFLDTNYHQLALKVGDYKIDPLSALSDGAYYRLSGTSMAAPMVAGAAALMLQKEPGLNPATVKARLMASAVKDGRLVFETGAGYLDIDAALKATGTAVSALSPQASLSSDGSILISDTALIWGSTWSLSNIWGGGGRTLCNQSMIWNNAVTASGLIWSYDASSLIWASGTVMDDAAVWAHKSGK